MNENDFEVHKEKGHEKVCELKSVVFDERNYTCEVCNFECSEECVFKRHNKVNHDKTTQSTTLYPKKRRKLSGEDQMETSESIETQIVGDDLTIQGEVFWVDARKSNIKDHKDNDDEESIFLRSNLQDDKVKKKGENI